MGLNSRTKSISAQVCAQAKSQKRLQRDLTSQLQVTSGHTATLQCGKIMVTVQVRSIAMLQRRLHPWQVEWRSYAACRGKDLSCGTTRSTGCTYKSSGMLPIGDQSVAAIIDESLQVMVRTGTPPKGGQLSALWHSKVPKSKQSGVSSRSMKCFFSTSTDAVWAWCPGHR